MEEEAEGWHINAAGEGAPSAKEGTNGKGKKGLG